MIKYENLNAPEKIIYNAIENYTPIAEVVEILCDLFIDIDEKERNLYNSKLDKFLKLNFLTKNTLIAKNNDFIKKQFNKGIIFNKYSLIKAISDTFNTDFVLTNLLKLNEDEYNIFNNEIFLIEDANKIDNKEFLNFLEKELDVNSFEELKDKLHDRPFESLYSLFRSKFRDEFNIYIDLSNFAFYIYKLGFVILEKNIEITNDEFDSIKIMPLNTILHPDKI